MSSFILINNCDKNSCHLDTFARLTIKKKNSMKKIVLNITVATLVLTGLVACKEKGADATTGEAQEVAEATATASDYQVNTETSQIVWLGQKPTGKHHGTVQLVSGTLAVSEGVIEAGKFTIDMNSITDLDLEGEMKENLEAHLKGTVAGKEGDFFDVTKYPVASFELTGISEKEGKSMVAGNLTIKEKTHAIEFPATILTEDTMITLSSEPFQIDRTKWDVNYGSKTIFGDLGDKFINDMIELTIKVVANKS